MAKVKFGGVVKDICVQWIEDVKVGDLSSEPIILSNEEAIEKFENKVDGIITYNRDIFNRTDDSVITINNSVPRIIRRSRGNTPAPIRTQLNVEGIFAAGAELVNSFAIGKGKQAILSQYIGDLKNFETFEPGTLNISPKEVKITSSLDAIFKALSIISIGVTQTGQPGP